MNLERCKDGRKDAEMDVNVKIHVLCKDECLDLIRMNSWAGSTLSLEKVSSEFEKMMSNEIANIVSKQ